VAAGAGRAIAVANECVKRGERAARRKVASMFREADASGEVRSRYVLVTDM